MNIEDLFYAKKKEYRFLQEHVTELLGSRVTSFQLEALGCSYVPGRVMVTGWSGGRQVSRVWTCKDLDSVVSELRTGTIGPLGNRRGVA